MTNPSPTPMDALKEARDLAMKNTLAARIPECGDFAEIAQNLDWVITQLEESPDLIRQVEVESVDTPDFDELLLSVVQEHTEMPTFGSDPTAGYRNARAALIAHIDSIITARVDDVAAQLELMTEYRDDALMQVVKLKRALAASQAAPAELTVGTPEGFRVYAKGYASGRKKGFQDAQAAQAADKVQRNQDVSAICGAFGQQPNTSSFEVWAQESGVGGIEKNGARFLDSFTQVAWCAWQAGQSQAAPAKAEGWMPIETAPRDGSQIMLSNGVNVSQGWYVNEPCGTEVFRDEEGRYLDEKYHEGYQGFLDCEGGMLPEPTHWMSVPTPPSPPAKEPT